MASDLKFMSYEEALRDGASRLKQSDTPLLDARVLLKHAAQIDDARLIALANDRLPGPAAAVYDAAIARRANREPVAYIIGRKEFWSLEFDIAPEVLIPRADSECLIEFIVQRRAAREPYSILDLGTGAGCLLCALLHEFPQAHGIGVDRSPAAAAIARQNIRSLGFADRSSVVVGDWAAALGKNFDIVIANPPYVTNHERSSLAPDVVDFEPHDALFAGEDGLGPYRDILAALPQQVSDRGVVVFEAGEGQRGGLPELVSKSFPEAETGVINDMKGRFRGVFADFNS